MNILFKYSIVNKIILLYLYTVLYKTKNMPRALLKRLIIVSTEGVEFAFAVRCIFKKHNVLIKRKNS